MKRVAERLTPFACNNTTEIGYGAGIRSPKFGYTCYTNGKYTESGLYEVIGVDFGPVSTYETRKEARAALLVLLNNEISAY